MSKISIIDKIKKVEIDKEPMILLPLNLWQKFEDYLEDQEALSSKRFIRRIEKSREDISLKKLIYPFN
ncbi:MAG: hypothetical protein AAB405_01415 [Patescibacteria group bacterium]